MPSTFARKSSKAFAKEGGIAASESRRRSAARPRVVIILVVNADQTSEVLFGKDGAAGTLAQGSVVIASSTVAPEFAIDLGKRLDAKGLLMIDAPVSGGAAPRRQGRTFDHGLRHPKTAFKKADAVLKAIAIKVYELGDDAGIGSKVKMINQLLAGVHIAAAAEAIALGIRAGADPQGASTMSFPTAPARRGCSRTACRTSSPATTRRCPP